MRVGVVEHPPWTNLPPRGGAWGIEGALVAELARDVRARIEWVRAPESRLLRALELEELDVVIGGLTADNPWKRRVAFTSPIYTDTIVGGGPERLAPLRDLRGQAVAVLHGDPAAASRSTKRATSSRSRRVIIRGGRRSRGRWRSAKRPFPRC